MAAMLVVASLPFALFFATREPNRQAPTGPRPALPRWPMIALFLAMAAMGAILGAIQTGVTAYATSAAGLLYAELGIGSALAGVACGWLPATFGWWRRYVVFAATLLAGMTTLAAGVPVPIAIAVAGVTVAPYMISLYALTDHIAPPSRAAVAMTILCAGGPLGSAVGRAVAGRLADTYGSVGAFAVAPAAAGLALALAVVVVVRRARAKKKLRTACGERRSTHWPWVAKVRGMTFG
ncbi:MFS transporter [Fodinicola feengrottensis]|uniref:MFS transporter n=1 Tax=Fodinicola feengrottensis TaxID=435914 RepID=UPI0013D2938C|nr:MFS transporter [Fodinicola feengrottensis]